LTKILIKKQLRQPIFLPGIYSRWL